MKKRHRVGWYHRWIGTAMPRHTAALIVSALALVTCASLLLFTYFSVEREVDRNMTAMQDMIKQSDVEIREIKERKAAEKKAAQEAAARKAAEQAQAATSQTAYDTNASQCNHAVKHTDPAKIDVLVNKKHCLKPLHFTPSDLRTSNGATLSAKAIDAYDRLYSAAAAAGQAFYVTSSYRSYSSQVATYNHWVATSGAAQADTYSARPGYSEHQTGFVIDVAAQGCVLSCFGTTSQYKWLQQNAAEYGFIQRYYAGHEGVTGYVAEEWHYRYVGVAVAKDMQEKKIKTLEEYWGLPGGNYY